MAIQLSDHFTYRKLFRFVVPSVVMMVFTSVYGVVDGLFVSNYVGKTSFAAVNLVMPVIMILGGLGFMFGTGGSALISRTLGLGSREKANRYFSMVVYLTVVTGILLSAFGIIFMRSISIFLGADDNMLNECVVYGRVVLIFNTFFMLQNVFQSFFAAAEKPKLGLAVTISAGITNMVFDALFIAVFKMGVMGAALATGISQFAGGILPLIYFARPNKSLLRLKRTKMQSKPLINVCINGSSELMSNISSSLVSIIYNFQLMKYAGENGVAAYGVLMYVQFIFIGVFMGYSVGTAPIAGYNYGAGRNGELKNMFKKSIIIMSIFGIAMMALCKIFAGFFSYIFTAYDAKLFEMTKRAFELVSYSFLLTGINIFASGFFTALDNGVISAVISFLRTFVFKMLSAVIFPLFFGLDGIWFSITAAEIFAFIISAAFMAAKKDKYHY